MAPERLHRDPPRRKQILTCASASTYRHWLST
jgi:carbon storage regulator